MTKINDLEFDNKNFNKHTQKGMGLLDKSLRNYGAGRSILIDKNNRIIAGNGIVEAAGQIGLEDVQIVESDGKKIIAVKRTDVDLDSHQGREMALADNATASADLSWDLDAMQSAGLSKNDVAEWIDDVNGWNDEYDDFVDKFKPKLTTDDCYTPKAVATAVEKWVRETYSIKCENIRPFKPGGDYQAEDYTDRVVIDNPPFSILSEICRWYDARGIKFFLYAPHLTLFNIAPELKVCRVVCGASVIYENGALVRTSFITNMEPEENRIFCGASLCKAIEEAQPDEGKELEKYNRPKNCKISNDFVYVVKAGHDIKFKSDEVCLVKNLDKLKEVKKGLFGGGFLVSDKVAEKLAEEKLAVKKLAEEKLAVKVELSDREKEIVKKLNNGEMKINE